jgi:hypothetical protein
MAGTTENFDPYYKWLGIPLEEQPPHHYRLLGIQLFESDGEVISHAADQRMAHIRSFRTGKNAVLSQQILNEIAAARICLLQPQKKDQYDDDLRRELTAHPVQLAKHPLAAPPPAPSLGAPPVAPPAPPSYPSLPVPDIYGGGIPHRPAGPLPTAASAPLLPMDFHSAPTTIERHHSAFDPMAELFSGGSSRPAAAYVRRTSNKRASPAPTMIVVSVVVLVLVGGFVMFMLAKGGGDSGGSESDRIPPAKEQKWDSSKPPDAKSTHPDPGHKPLIPPGKSPPAPTDKSKPSIPKDPAHRPPPGTNPSPPNFPQDGADSPDQEMLKRSLEKAP